MNFINWHKSAKSGNQGNCLEQGESRDGQLIGVRDTKNPGVILVVTRGEWTAFVDGIKAGELDH